MITREQFYKSKQWLNFRKVIIADRTGSDGFVHCCACNKPILQKYDLIIHHKKELSEDNVNDAMIALNPDNVEVICFKCHNKVHERFGYHTSSPAHVQKQVYIVYGSPCSGKSTWVNEVANEDDLIVDLDNIWQMISINNRYNKPDALKSVVFEMRDKLYDIIKYRSGKWHNAYIITGGALKGDRERLKQRIGADDFIFIDTDHDTCIQRANARSKDHAEADIDWMKVVEDWFNSFQKDEEVVEQ